MPSLEQIRNDPLHGDVADRLPEEEGLHRGGGDLGERGEGQQQATEAGPAAAAAAATVRRWRAWKEMRAKEFANIQYLLRI